MRFLLLLLLLFSPSAGRATVRYVNANSVNPISPFTNWVEAALTIQDAVDVAEAGDQIIVTNGVYQTGGKVVADSLTNRVAITKPLTVVSVNGPATTIIQGRQILGDSAVRCVYLGDNAFLSGFTLRNGGTRNTGYGGNADRGGGLFGQSFSAVASNCVLTGNSASGFGGGAAGSKLVNCVITNNSAATYGGGGVYMSVVNNSVIISNRALGSSPGGGAYGFGLTNCVIVGNSSGWSGGGAYHARLLNCVVRKNTAPSGGGVTGNWQEGDVNYCTIVQNTASKGGGVYDCYAYNSIVYYNTNAPTSYGQDAYGSLLLHCCTAGPIPSDIRNFTNPPAFVSLAAGNLRLQSNSPCINSSESASAPSLTDLDGNPRVVGGYADVGAFEYQNPSAVIAQYWLQKYGLLTDGSADFVDLDGDGMDNWKEWRAATDPTNSQSLMLLETPTRIASGTVLRWTGQVGRRYFMERCTNLSEALFLRMRTNIPGPPSIGFTNSILDTNLDISQSSYRLGIEE